MSDNIKQRICNIFGNNNIYDFIKALNNWKTIDGLWNFAKKRLIEEDINQIQVNNLVETMKELKPNLKFDIIIDKDRFISFPIWFSKKEYEKREKIEKEKNDKRTKIEKEKNDKKSKSEAYKQVEKYFKLNMFNIIFVFSNEGPMNINCELFKNVYSNLESLSKLLLFEEYNKHYLGFATHRIINIIKNLFKKDNINFIDFVEKFPQNNNLYSYVKNLYEGISRNEISNVMVSNIELNYYIGMYSNQLSSIKIRPYHILIINNRKNLNNFFLSIKDINPKILIIMDKILQMKTLEEISLENNIELNFVLFFANQLVSWNLARIIFKFNNNSTFQISDSIPEGIIKLRQQVGVLGLLGFNGAINILNDFTMSESTTTLNEIYQANFNTIDIDEFKQCILFLVENHYLVQTSIIIFSKLKIKEFDKNKTIIDKLSDLINHNNILNEENISEDNDNIYYEDFLKLVKHKSMEDFIILANIKEFINKHLYINEISYYTGYKIKDILSTVNKYEAIFDLVVVPL